MTTKTPFAAIETTELTTITGGATRSSGSNDAKLQTMLTSITDSIKDVATPKTSAMDQMMPMMMMMMMGGGGSQAPAAPPPPPPSVIKVNVRR